MTFSTQDQTLIQQPEVIINPVTGDRMTILHSSLQQVDRYTKIRFDLPPGAEGSPMHYHPSMGETFTVLQGCLEMEIGQKGNVRTLQTGEQVHVPPGVQHSFRNSSGQWIAFTTENRPAIGFEQFIRGMYGLAIEGKTDGKGMPKNLLHLALLLKKADTILVGPPPVLQKLLIGALIEIGKWMDVERALSKYWQRK
jgi:quercetin dioxygenase-like cupin family protein